MNDDANQSTTDPAQDPLSVLEGILEEAKKKSGGSGGVQSASTDSSSVTPTADASSDAVAEAEAHKADLIAQRAAEAAEQEAKKQAQIAEYRQKMLGVIENTEAYKARVSQDDDDKKDKDAHISGAGFDINQLEHKKI